MKIQTCILKDSVIDWLLEKNNPSVRYLTLTKILRLPDNNSDVRESRQAIMTQGLVPLILEIFL